MIPTVRQLLTPLCVGPYCKGAACTHAPVPRPGGNSASWAAFKISPAYKTWCWAEMTSMQQIPERPLLKGERAPEATAWNYQSALDCCCVHEELGQPPPTSSAPSLQCGSSRRAQGSLGRGRHPSCPCFVMPLASHLPATCASSPQPRVSLPASAPSHQNPPTSLIPSCFSSLCTHPEWR